MNLIDAIKSGLPIRRKSSVISVVGDPQAVVWLDLDEGEDHRLSRDDILATDWEVLEHFVTITNRQFWDAVAGSFSFTKTQDQDAVVRGLQTMVKKLGLESR